MNAQMVFKENQEAPLVEVSCSFSISMWFWTPISVEMDLSCQEHQEVINLEELKWPSSKAQEIEEL